MSFPTRFPLRFHLWEQVEILVDMSKDEYMVRKYNITNYQPSEIYSGKRMQINIARTRTVFAAKYELKKLEKLVINLEPEITPNFQGVKNWEK